jgi:transposase-like protein
MEGKIVKVRKWRRHTAEFKRQVVERMKTCENIEALARELDLERKLLYTWKHQIEGRPEARHANLQLSAEERKIQNLRRENEQLKKVLGQKALEVDFLEDALFRVNQAQQTSATGVDASTNPSGRGRKSKAN